MPQCKPKRMPLLTSALLLVVLLQGCVLVPRTIETYDPDCRMLRRQMTLEMVNIGVYQGCSQDACAAMLAATGLVTAASLVVSGSVAVVGNVVYWFENEKKCVRGAPPGA